MPQTTTCTIETDVMSVTSQEMHHNDPFENTYDNPKTNSELVEITKTMNHSNSY